MLPENDNTSKFNQYMRSDKMPQNADPESSIKKIGGCANIEKPSTTKLGEDNFCGYSMSSSREFDYIANKYTLHLGENCLKKVS